MIVAGLTAGGRGLPKPTPLVRLRSYLVPRECFHPEIYLDGKPIPYEEPTRTPGSAAAPHEALPAEPFRSPIRSSFHSSPLRTPGAGDKGADSNIGVRARHPDFLRLLRDQLSAQAVAEWFTHRIDGAVERYDVPGIQALNFVLRNALGGGGIASLRFDPQGKAYAQQLLDMPMQVPAAWLAHPAIANIPEVQHARGIRGQSPF